MGRKMKPNRQKRGGLWVETETKWKETRDLQVDETKLIETREFMKTEKKFITQVDLWKKTKPSGKKQGGSWEENKTLNNKSRGAE